MYLLSNDMKIKIKNELYDAIDTLLSSIDETIDERNIQMTKDKEDKFFFYDILSLSECISITYIDIFINRVE